MKDKKNIKLSTTAALQILESKGETNAAIPILQKGATLDPDSKAIQQVMQARPLIVQINNFLFGAAFIKMRFEITS